VVEGHLDGHAPAEDSLMEGAEIRQRTDLEGGISDETVV
jgi:hypothetical protein